MSLFHRFGYIYKPHAGGSWFSANEAWKLTDSEILKAIACAHPKYILGCRSGKSTRFAVIDIDNDSQYHNQQSLNELLQILAAAGLTCSSLFRSSYSEGWHVYIFFDEAINCNELRRNLCKLLRFHEYKIAKGQLEVFPQTGESGSLGLGLRLPLQKGFAWLDQRTLEVDYERHEISATKALELFIDALESNSNSYAAFRQFKGYVQELEERYQAATKHGVGKIPSNVIPITRSEKQDRVNVHGEFVSAVFSKLPPGIIIDSWYKGRLYHLSGLTGPSQRAEAIECLSHYFFYGDPSRDLPALGYGYEQEREWAIKEFLRLRHNGQSEDFNKGRADAVSQIERCAHWRPPHRRSDEPKKYRSKTPISWTRANANRKTSARKRITNALHSLKEEQRRFSTEELRKAASCSRETLYKHEDIWRKDYNDLADVFFAACTGEYNVVVGAASSKSKPPTTIETTDMPLERLAARQIASELSMRIKRAEDRSRKAAIRSQNEQEKEWQGKVEDFLKQASKEPDFQKLKALIVILTTYLAMAPTEEQQIRLQLELQQLKNRASKHSLHLVSETQRPPPPT